MTNQRKAFEKWHKTKYRGLKYNSDSNGGFLNPRTDLDFDIWQAAQAAQADQAETIAQLQAENDRLTSLEFNVTTDNIILHGEIADLKGEAFSACKEALEQQESQSQSQSKPLSDEEKLEIIRKWSESESMRIQDLIGICDLIEKAHGIE